MIKTWISVLWLTCSAQLPLQTPPKRYRRSPGCSKPVSLPSGRQIPLLWAIAAQTETQKRISLQDQLNIYNPCLCKYVLIKKSALGITPHLLVRSYSPAKVSQQVVCVAEVPVGSTLSGAISELLHYRQVRPEITVTVSLIRHRHIHTYTFTRTVLCSHSLIVLGCLPQSHHHLLWEISGLSSTPADTFAFGMVHIPEVIQSSRLTHLTRVQEEHVRAVDVFWMPPQTTGCFSVNNDHEYHKVSHSLTLSLMSRAMSKCLWQQTTASSNRPSTFNVLPRFPLALASPSRSPIVLHNTH